MAAASSARRRAAAKQNRKTRAPPSTDGEKKKTLSIDAILKKPNILGFGLGNSFGTASNNDEEFQSSFMSQGSGSKGSKKKKASSDVRSSSTKRDGGRSSSTKRGGARSSSTKKDGGRPLSAKSAVSPPSKESNARPASRVVQDFTMSFAPTASFANLLKNMSDDEDKSSDDDSLDISGKMLNISYKSQKSSDSGPSVASRLEKSAPELTNRNYTSQISSGSGTSGDGGKTTTDAEREAAAVAKIQSVFAGVGKGEEAGDTKLKAIAHKMIIGQRLSGFAKEASARALDVNNDTNPPDDSDLYVPEVVLALWKIVAEGAIDGSANINEIYTALETAKKYYTTTKEGREFVDQNLYAIIKLFLSLSPRTLSLDRDQMGETEYSKVEKSIRFALQLINDDLRTKGHKFTAKCETLNALHKILDHKNIYFHKSTPAVRMDKILVFQRIKGFYHLAIYLNARANTKVFPEWELVHRGLKTAYEGLASSQVTGSDANFQDKFRKEAKNMCEGVMQHLKSMKLDVLENQEIFKVNIIMNDMKLLFSEIAISYPAAILDYFAFRKVLVLKLLSTNSEEHSQYGEEMLHGLIESTRATRPIVKAYQVEGSGIDFVDGAYAVSSSKLDKEGYLIPGLEVRYERLVDSEQKMVLFYDKSFADGDPAWCLSEEHEDEPGQHEYTDYFVAYGSSKDPPVDQWEPVDDADASCPTVEGLPGMIPIREEHKSIKEDIARWLIEKKIPDLVLGTNICGPCDTSAASRVVEALDSYAEGGNLLSSKTANLLVSLFPSFQSSSELPRKSSILSSSKQDSSASKAAIETAKARLASAERWKETASKSLKSAQTALMSAKTEHQAAITEAEEARKYLASLDSNYESNGYNESISSVGFVEDTSTITYDDQKPSKFVNDESSSSSSSSEEMVLKQRGNPNLSYY